MTQNYRIEQIAVDGLSMETLVFEPVGDGPHPAVIVAQHLPVAHAGLETDPFTLDVGERLAAAGYLAVVPFLFHRWPRDLDRMEKVQGWRDDQNIADLTATFEFVAEDEAADADRIAIVGHCWGGRIAWIGACMNERYRAAAMFYGGRIMLGLGPDAEPAIGFADRIACPMLGIFGNDDQNPSPDEVNEIGQALAEAGVEHEFHHFDGAGHGFQDFTNAERYRPTQSDEAWTILLDFLARELA